MLLAQFLLNYPSVGGAQFDATRFERRRTMTKIMLMAFIGCVVWLLTLQVYTPY
jgi:hypothetical protein